MNLYVRLLALHNTCALDSSYFLVRKEQLHKESTEFAHLHSKYKAQLVGKFHWIQFLSFSQSLTHFSVWQVLKWKKKKTKTIMPFPRLFTDKWNRAEQHVARPAWNKLYSGIPAPTNITFTGLHIIGTSMLWT